jgi:hypothetical protein
MSASIFRTIPFNAVLVSRSYCRFAPIESKSTRLNAGSFAIISGLRDASVAVCLVEKAAECRSERYSMQVATDSDGSLRFSLTCGASLGLSYNLGLAH